MVNSNFILIYETHAFNSRNQCGKTRVRPRSRIINISRGPTRNNVAPICLMHEPLTSPSDVTPINFD